MKDDGEATVLSPQRRGFSSGCRAPEERMADGDDGKNKGRTWRQGATSGPQKADYKYVSFLIEFSRKYSMSECLFLEE